MLIGYMRVSTESQDPGLQKKALIEEGVKPEHIFYDQASGAKTVRPGIDACLKFMRKGDTLIVWRLDRLGRSLKDLVELVENIREKGVSFKSIHDGIEARADNTNLTGDLVFKLFAVLSEFERNLIRERTKAGLSAARKRGRQGGRPKGPKSEQKVKLARQLSQDKSLSLKEILTILGISKSTYYRYIKDDKNGQERDSSRGLN